MSTSDDNGVWVFWAIVIAVFLIIGYLNDFSQKYDPHPSGGYHDAPGAPPPDVQCYEVNSFC